MRSEELKDLSYVEANSKLDDEEFEEWRKARREGLLESAHENRIKWAERDSKAENDLLEIGESGIRETVTVDGKEIDVRLLMNREQRNKMQRLMSYKQEFENLDENERIEKMDEVEDFFCEFLADLCPDYSKQDFLQYSNQKGLPALNKLGGKLIKPVMEEFSKKNQESNNMQNVKE